MGNKKADRSYREQVRRGIIDISRTLDPKKDLCLHAKAEKGSKGNYTFQQMSEDFETLRLEALGFAFNYDSCHNELEGLKELMEEEDDDE